MCAERVHCRKFRVGTLSLRIERSEFQTLGLNMADALRHIYDAYRGQIAEAKGLVD